MDELCAQIIFLCQQANGSNEAPVKFGRIWTKSLPRLKVIWENAARVMNSIGLALILVHWSLDNYT
jgi:hypothetical protein